MKGLSSGLKFTARTQALILLISLRIDWVTVSVNFILWIHTQKSLLSICHLSIYISISQQLNWIQSLSVYIQIKKQTGHLMKYVYSVFYTCEV